MKRVRSALDVSDLKDENLRMENISNFVLKVLDPNGKFIHIKPGESALVMQEYRSEAFEDRGFLRKPVDKRADSNEVDDS